MIPGLEPNFVRAVPLQRRRGLSGPRPIALLRLTSAPSANRDGHPIVLHFRAFCMLSLRRERQGPQL